MWFIYYNTTLLKLTVIGIELALKTCTFKTVKLFWVVRLMIRLLAVKVPVGLELVAFWLSTISVALLIAVIVVPDGMSGLLTVIPTRRSAVLDKETLLELLVNATPVKLMSANCPIVATEFSYCVPIRVEPDKLVANPFSMNNLEVLMLRPCFKDNVYSIDVKFVLAVLSIGTGELVLTGG